MIPIFRGPIAETHDWVEPLCSPVFFGLCALPLNRGDDRDAGSRSGAHSAGYCWQDSAGKEYRHVTVFHRRKVATAADYDCSAAGTAETARGLCYVRKEHLQINLLCRPVVGEPTEQRVWAGLVLDGQRRNLLIVQPVQRTCDREIGSWRQLRAENLFVVRAGRRPDGDQP